MKNTERNPGNQGNRSQSDVQISRQAGGRERETGFPTLFNTFFGNDFPSLFNWDFPTLSRVSRSVPAVNIRERKDDFIIDVAAPGMQKDDFDVRVEDNTLQIAAERKYERSEEDENYTRKEFEQNSFCRYFSLPESVNPDQINANYTDGVLHITLPKKEEAKGKPARQINIS